VKISVKVSSFDDLEDVMSTETISALKRTYASVEDVDLYTGGLAEVPTKGAVVGPTFACLIGRQMLYYKTGDRYWQAMATLGRLTHSL